MLRFCSNCIYFQFPSVCCADPECRPRPYDDGCVMHQTIEEFRAESPLVVDLSEVPDFDDYDIPF